MPDFSPDFENSERNVGCEEGRKIDFYNGAEKYSEEYNQKFEKARQGMKEYIRKKENDDLFEYWSSNFEDNPTNFFSEENFEKLRDFSVGERLVLLSYAARSLEVTPQLVKKHLDAFSVDGLAIKQLLDEHGLATQDKADHNLYSTSFPFIDKSYYESDPRSSDQRIKDYEDRAKRRSLAPNHLLDEYRPSIVSKKINELHQEAEGYESVWETASELNRPGKGRAMLRTEGIFTEELESLPDDKKAEILRLFIADLQTTLVYDEVHNSLFNSENIRNRSNDQWDIAHSMLFNSHQPISSYRGHEDSAINRQLHGPKFGVGELEELPFHKMLLAVIEKISEVDAQVDKNTKLLVDLWDKNRNPIFASKISNALSEMNTELAASELMKRVKNDKTSNKNALAAILYRLELGKIGISEEGVQYLERHYDLRELNNPEFFAKRLTGRGQMGVFDEEGQMQGMFDLGDLTDGKKEVQAEVYELTYEMLFVPKEDESEQERRRREQVLEEFKEHYFDFYGEEFHEETGVYFNNLDLREQGAFMQFAREATDEQADAAMDIVKQYGESALQSFVAHAENQDMGKMLLKIADSLPDAAAQSVFREYAGFVEVVNDLESYIAEEFSIEDSNQFSDRVAGAILERGENLFRLASKKEKNYNELSNEVSDLANSTMVFLHGLKELRRSNQSLDPELLEKSEMARTDSESINDQEFAQMEDIYVQNYPKDKYDEAVRKSLLNKLQQIRKSNDGEFYTLKYKGEIKAFLGLKEDRDDDGRSTKQAAAFNVDPEFQNFAIGHMMIENALAREANSSTLIANSNAQSTLTAHYIERGFVGTQVSSQHESEVLDIAWDKDQNNQYRFKYSDIDKIVEAFDQNTDSQGVASLSTGEKIIKKDSWRQVDLESHLPESVVTRAFSEDGNWYVVFEPAPNKEYPEAIK